MKSKELAYWIGVVQTDGYFKKYYDKYKKNQKYYIVLEVAKCSLEMFEKFRSISIDLFNIKGSYWISNREHFNFKMGCKRYLFLFKELDINFSDPPKPPSWVFSSKEYAGSYLAGVIDGDGNICITRPKYPQCKVRIYSSVKQDKLILFLSEFLNCSIHQHISYSTSMIKDRIIYGKTSIIQFYVSPKNIDFIYNHVLNNISINRKKEKLINFKKKRLGRIELPSSEPQSNVLTTILQSPS
jgi:hypothetical protein